MAGDRRDRDASGNDHRYGRPSDQRMQPCSCLSFHFSSMRWLMSTRRRLLSRRGLVCEEADGRPAHLDLRAVKITRFAPASVATIFAC
jgi:hypothetical protein